MKTFEEFVASKVRYEHGFPQMEVEGPCWVYDLCCSISGPMPNGDFHLTIYNAQWTGDLDYLEGILYEEYYLPEICGHAS